MSVYIPHVNSMQSTMSPQALVYMHFRLLTPAQVNMPATLHVYIQLHYYSSLHIGDPVGFQLSSNTHMYYACGNHIYSSLSMAT